MWRNALKLTICILMILFNFILYFVIGSLITGRMKKTRFSVSLSVLAGFFLYYSLFTFFCIPVMYRWRPLSMLSRIWGAFVLALLVLSFVLNHKIWKKKGRELLHFVRTNKAFVAGLFLLVVIQTVVIVYAYQFTLDAAYYVANVATSLETDSLNIYDPYTGDWQDHFEMRYFFATYPMNDAVVCQIFKIHPLLQTKIIMSSIAVILTNMVYYMIARELFGKKRESVFFLMLFAGIIHFFFITIFTSSNFLITRSYEGKNLLGNVVLPGILYLYIRMLGRKKNTAEWVLLFLVCFGSTVLSSSSNMLVPAAMSVLMIPLAVFKRDWKVIPKYLVCILPCLIMLVVYVAYVKGMFVFYTYPR